MEEHTASKPSAAKPTWASPPRQVEGSPAGAAEFVICDHTIEQCFEEAKTELGMDQYEMRKYPGWHHHLLTCMLAHFFLWHVKIRLGKKSPSAYGIAAEAAARGDLTAQNLYDCGSPPFGNLDTAEKPPGVPCT